MFFPNPPIPVPTAFLIFSNSFIKFQPYLQQNFLELWPTQLPKNMLNHPFRTFVPIHLPSPSTLQIRIIERDPVLLKDTKEGFESIEFFIWYKNNMKHFLDKICT